MEQYTRGPETLIAGADLAGRACPYCRFPLKEGAGAVVCADCHAAHHVDCWSDNGGCAITACPGGPATAQFATQPPNALPPAQKGAPVVIPGDMYADYPPPLAAAPPPSAFAPAPLQPSGPPPPLGGEGPRRRTPGPSLSIALIVLALAIGGVAAALIVSKKSSRATTITQVSGTVPSTPTTPPPVGTGPTIPSFGPGTTGGNGSTTTPQPPNSGSGTGSGAGDPAAALRQYWTLVDQGQYAQAFAMETSNEQGNDPGFVSERQAAQPKINIQSIGSPSSTSGDADVPIQFWTQDTNPTPGSDTQCRFWNMTAHMVQNNGTWLYDGPVSGTANATVENGNPNCHS